MKIHGLLIRKLKQERKITWSRLATACDVSTATLMRWVNGKQNPHPDNVIRLALALGIEPDKLEVNDNRQKQPKDSSAPHTRTTPRHGFVETVLKALGSPQDFPLERQQQILRGIADILGFDPPSFTSIEPTNSVYLTLHLPIRHAEKLVRAVDKGQLASFGIYVAVVLTSEFSRSRSARYRDLSDTRPESFDNELLMLMPLLSEEDKQLIGLIEEGYSSTEIANKLGLTLDSYFKRFRRLMSLLTTLLAERDRT